jgi:hypothetical protein
MGLRRINHTVELADTPSIRGMIHKGASPRHGELTHTGWD